MQKKCQSAIIFENIQNAEYMYFLLRKQKLAKLFYNIK